MADGQTQVQAQFKEMLEGTKEDWDIIVEHSKHFNQGLAKRVLDHLRLLDGDYGGFPVDRLTHSLQTATRAHRDGRDEEYSYLRKRRKRRDIPLRIASMSPANANNQELLGKNGRFCCFP